MIHMTATDALKTNRVMMDTDAKCFAKINLVRAPFMVVTEHYNNLSEYFTVHIDLFMFVNKRNLFGMSRQKTFTGSAALYCELSDKVVRKSVDISEFSAFSQELQDYLTQELTDALMTALQSDLRFA